MGILEIISGVLLIFCSVVITMLVMAQEANGGMGAVGGGNMMDMGSRSTDARIAKVTQYAGVAFFVLAIVVNAINVLAK